jgi:hypothetical protein
VSLHGVIAAAAMAAVMGLAPPSEYTLVCFCLRLRSLPLPAHTAKVSVTHSGRHEGLKLENLQASDILTMRPAVPCCWCRFGGCIPLPKDHAHAAPRRHTGLQVA